MDQMIKVWDPFVRFFHWSLVVSFAIAWLTADEWDRVHELAGYTIGGLVAFRIVWGLAGPKYARFAQFMRTPAAVKEYMTDMLKGRERRYIGHNPAGGAMVVCLLLALGGTALTGWMTTLDAFWGMKIVEGAHELLANLTIGLVIVHIAGVLLASMRHRENPIRAMVVGRKQAPGPLDVN